MLRQVASALALTAGLTAAACHDATTTTTPRDDRPSATTAGNGTGVAPATAPIVRDPLAPRDMTGTRDATAMNDGTGKVTTAADGSAVPTNAAKASADDQVLATLTALNQGEVDQANAALPKLANAEAKYFANMMLRHHSEGVAKLSAIANEEKLSVTDNATARSLRAQSTDLVGKTSSMTAGPVLDRMYMQAQVDGHTKALRLIDGEILPNIKNDKLKAAAMEMRTRVQYHLSTAQTTLNGMPAS